MSTKMLFYCPLPGPAANSYHETVLPDTYPETTAHIPLSDFIRFYLVLNPYPYLYQQVQKTLRYSGVFPAVVRIPPPFKNPFKKTAKSCSFEGIIVMYYLFSRLLISHESS